MHKPQPQSVDRDGAIEQQTAVHAEALRRAKLRSNLTESADSPDRDREVRIAAGCSPRGGTTADATLNWAAGLATATVGKNDEPFSGDNTRVAGVGASSPMPDPGAAYPHGASGMDEIVNHPGGRK
jgi:hypothetical protein